MYVYKIVIMMRGMGVLFDIAVLSINLYWITCII